MTVSRLPRRIVCTIVRIHGDDSRPTTARFDLPAGDRFSNPADRLAGSTAHRRERPSELLPWADPYIANLVRRLQNEVRQERGGACQVVAEIAELDPPSPALDGDFDWPQWDEPRWPQGDGLN